MSTKLKHVVLNSDVYKLCFMHAGHVEKIELLGLLLGEVIEGTTYIYGFSALHRNSPEIKISETHLNEVMERAKELESTMQKPIRIVGWYHSTPLFTVWPSYLEEQTKLKYNLSDCQFVGLIFSNYSDANPGRMQMSTICYQASDFDGKILSRGAPFIIEHVPFKAFNLMSLADLPLHLNDVYLDMFKKCGIDVEGHPLINQNNQMFYSVLNITRSISDFFQSTIERLRLETKTDEMDVEKSEESTATTETARTEGRNEELEGDIATAETPDVGGSPSKKIKIKS